MEIKLIPPREAGKFCDHIKLSEFNQIQSYGVLLLLDLNLRIVQYSTNLTTLLNTQTSSLLGAFAADYLIADSTQEESLISWLKQANHQYQHMHWRSESGGLAVCVWVHQVSEGILLEIEPDLENKEEREGLLSLTQYAASTLERSSRIHEIHQLVQTTCEDIQKISDFDRVIVYQFDQFDHSGLVIGEVLKEGMESYLGLRFPANDVPQHVRAMYINLPLRYIPSIHEKPLKLVPEINPISQCPLDLSYTNLRMVAPVHIQYLSNMKVSAATSIGILHNKKLWGLIACHHKAPKYVSANLRFILTLMANTMASQIIALEYVRDAAQQQKIITIQNNITEHFTQENSLATALVQHHQLLMELVLAQGMSISLPNNLLHFGETPTSEQVQDLLAWIQAHHASKTYVTHTLPLQYKKAMDYKDKACGILAIKMTPIENHYIVFYRREFIHEVKWGGNPNQTLKGNSVDYSPRDSFERFLEVIVNHSARWHRHEQNAAEFIRSTIINKQLQDLLQSQALHDPLTGLLNRLYMEQSLNIEVQRAVREKQPVAVLLLDIDLFRNFNNQFGHLAGDFVLKQLAAFLKAHFRGYDHIYRYGGEEFFLILPRLGEAEAKERAESLREAVKKLVVEFEGQKLPVIAVSIGVSVYPTHVTDAASLIASADAALYQAKERGRDRVVIASP